MGKFFIARPIFAIALAAAIVLLGIISIFDLPIEQYPDITPPVVEVSTTYPGADAETVNNAVATPVSQSIMGVSDMLYIIQSKTLSKVSASIALIIKSFRV